MAYTNYNNIYCHEFISRTEEENELVNVLNMTGCTKDLCNVHGFVTPVRDIKEGYAISRCSLCEKETDGLKILALYFHIQKRSDATLSGPTSHISNRIVAVIDSTIHPITKPSSKEHKWWNGYYSTHGILTQLLIDFDGFIVCVATNLKGHIHDMNIALYMKEFKDILAG